MHANPIPAPRAAALIPASRAAALRIFASRFDGANFPRLLFFIWGSILFLGSFLLFQAQPIAGRFLLPYFGGGAGVWTTCMVFFQSLLLCGYGYAHAMAAYVPRRRHAAIHASLAFLSLLTLPIIPDIAGLDIDSGRPIPALLGLLLVTLGLPYFMLATQTPLLQSWLSGIAPDRSIYRLYSISNIGSILALLGYPFLIERAIGLNDQARLWSALYAAMVVALLISILWARRIIARNPPELAPLDNDDGGAENETPSIGFSFGRWLWWVGLSASASTLLLAVTEELTRDVAPFPFLWIVPLCLYLFTFVLCFDIRNFYTRPVFWIAAPVSLLMVLSSIRVNASYLIGGFSLPELVGGVLWSGSVFLTEIFIWNSLLFVFCMIAHGEIVRGKPSSRKLSGFYLALGVGGASGGIFAGVIAPQIFIDTYELPLALMSILILAGAGQLTDLTSSEGALARLRPWLRRLAVLLIVVPPAAAVGYLFKPALNENVVLKMRNFYGPFSVEHVQGEEPQETFRHFYHGIIQHGAQVMDDDLKTFPTSYFIPESGIGRAIEILQERQSSIKVGVLGLGVGTIAAYARKDDTFRFYEINPDVIDVAQTWFSYLEDSPGNIELVVGDGRLELSREDPSNMYDLLVMDAFSGDSIPTHLLTKEAFELYLSRLKPDGLLVFNISNQYLDVGPVVEAQAHLFGLPYQFVEYLVGSDSPYISYIFQKQSSLWIILSRDPETIAALHPIIPDPETVIDPRDQWSDDYSSVIHLLR